MELEADPGPDAGRTHHWRYGVSLGHYRVVVTGQRSAIRSGVLTLLTLRRVSISDTFYLPCDGEIDGS